MFSKRLTFCGSETCRAIKGNVNALFLAGNIMIEFQEIDIVPGNNFITQQVLIVHVYIYLTPIYFPNVWWIFTLIKNEGSTQEGEGCCVQFRGCRLWFCWFGDRAASTCSFTSVCRSRFWRFKLNRKKWRQVSEVEGEGVASGTGETMKYDPEETDPSVWCPVRHRLFSCSS